MNQLLHQLITSQAGKTPEAVALRHKDDTLTYSGLSGSVQSVARYYQSLGLKRGERVGIYLPKRFETVIALFAASAADAVFVPINPILKAEQVQHILNDCNVKILVTAQNRIRPLLGTLQSCPNLDKLIVVDFNEEKLPDNIQIPVTPWKVDSSSPCATENVSYDVASILYTSGSTGKPKGVILSHQNMVVGAESVAEYLENSAKDRLLSVLPFSFDYGLSQLTTAFAVGASVVLLDYLLPKDVIRAVEKYEITGLAAVPPLWIQLAQLEWPEGARHIRYLTNSGGAMPTTVTQGLQQALPDTDIYLMYGLTEAFRSTYLPPKYLATHMTSMGKAIPNAEILILRKDGTLCDDDEPGELVHRGPLVGLGYWNDPEKTAHRYKPVPNQEGRPIPELAVWSGDTVKRDRDGFLYFIGREDEMIKTSGYRVSPSEVEECVYELGAVKEAIAVGIPNAALGESIELAVTLEPGETFDSGRILKHCQKQLPAFMVPRGVSCFDSFRRNPNGKIDRKAIHRQLSQPDDLDEA